MLITQNEAIFLIKHLNRILITRMYSFLDKLIAQNNMTHSQISSATGRFGNWFNRSSNKLEDMRISSFLKILSVIKTEGKLNSATLDSSNLESFINLLEIAGIINQLNCNQENVMAIIEDDMDIQDMILSVKSDSDRLSRDKNHNSSEEIVIFAKLHSYIKERRND